MKKILETSITISMYRTTMDQIISKFNQRFLVESPSLTAASECNKR